MSCDILLRNSSLSNFYLDAVSLGSPADTVIGDLIYPGQIFAIGRRASAALDYFDGMIDDVRIWDRALTSDNIEWLAENPGNIMPEPMTLLLLGGGIAGVWAAGGLGGLRRRKT